MIGRLKMARMLWSQILLTSLCVLCVSNSVSIAEESSPVRQHYRESKSFPKNDPWIMKASEVNERQMQGVVTLEFDAKEHSTREHLREFYANLRPIIADLLNQATPPNDSLVGSRIRRAPPSSTLRYSPDDVIVISIKPEVFHGFLRAPVFVMEPNGDVVSSRRLKRAVDGKASGTSLKKEDAYAGMPADAPATPTTPPPDKDGEKAGSGRQSVWEAHYWFFIIILILLGISAVLGLICCICFCCKRYRKQHRSPVVKQPVVKQQQQQPVLQQKSVEPQACEQLITPVNVAPVMAEQPPAPEPPSMDEENGWIIPMDQLTQEELQQTEVSFSKL